MGLDRGGARVSGSELEPTGERLVPEQQHGQLVHAEHLARYRWAAQLAGSRRVLDVACGEGYGTDILAAAGAREAVGVDLDAGAVAHATAKYHAPAFIEGDIASLPFDSGSFDLVVSFETIEHVGDPERALAELHRVLGEDGLLVISTPNKHRYLVENEFHEREFTHEEFVELLAARFPVVEVLLQHNWNASLVLPPELAGDSGGEAAHVLELRKVSAIEPGEELYTVAVCTMAGEIPSLQPLGVVASVDEAHDLARRLNDAEAAAALWHAEYRKAKQLEAEWLEAYEKTLAELKRVYASVWWRMTAPLRRVVGLVRRPRG
jgi:SAM-dependent methyltransferase